MIVVGTDRSAAALAASRAAVELATALGDTILFVTVWRELRGDFGLPLRALIPDVVDIERDWARETVASAAASAREAGLDATTEIRHGMPAREICAAAREHGARMIVVGSSGWGAVTSALVGSVSAEVVRESPCPVLVCRAPQADGTEEQPTSADSASERADG